MKHAEWCPDTPWLRRPVWINGKPVCHTCGRPNKELEQLELWNVSPERNSTE